MDNEKSVLLLTVLQQYEYLRDEIMGILHASKNIYETCLIPMTYANDRLYDDDREEMTKLSEKVWRIYDKLLEIKKIITEDYSSPE